MIVAQHPPPTPGTLEPAHPVGSNKVHLVRITYHSWNEVIGDLEEYHSPKVDSRNRISRFGGWGAGRDFLMVVASIEGGRMMLPLHTY